MKRCNQAHPLQREESGPSVKQHALDQVHNIVLVLGGRHFSYCHEEIVCVWPYLHVYFDRKLF